MKGLSFTGVQDFLALFIRRRWWLVWPFLTLSSAVVLFTYILPKMYVSDTLILIRPRDVPNDFVKDLIAGTTQERLSAIEQRVLSRTNLVQILHEFEDRLPEYQRFNMDDKVLKLRDAIQVTFDVDKRMGAPLPVTYFHVSYQNRNPELAQKITTKLSSLFIEQDNRAREDQVFGTTEFLNGEMEKVGEQLKESETKLKQLKERRRYELPDQIEPNLRTLDRLGQQQRTNAEALDRYANFRLNLERQLSETPAVLPVQTPVIPPVTMKAEDPDTPERYRKKKVELEELMSKYTPRHPEVEAAMAELARLKAMIPAGNLEELKKQEAEPKANTMPNPVFQSLTSQLQDVKTEFQIRENEKKYIESEIAKYSKRVQATPESEQEISNITRQNTDLNKQYTDLKDHLAQAKLSESLESRQKGSQFQIIDPANYPLAPAKPEKTKIVLIGIALSLAVGLATAVIVDLMSQRIWLQSEVESLFGVLVLGEIPAIATKADLADTRRKKQIFAVSSLAIAALYTVVLYLTYVKKAYVLTKLDPLIQRLMQ
jgi:polysaccharide chain length determinant protein (PEP-CTERM system associated)